MSKTTKRMTKPSKPSTKAKGAAPAKTPQTASPAETAKTAAPAETSVPVGAKSAAPENPAPEPRSTPIEVETPADELDTLVSATAHSLEALSFGLESLGDRAVDSGVSAIEAQLDLLESLCAARGTGDVLAAVEVYWSKTFDRLAADSAALTETALRTTVAGTDPFGAGLAHIFDSPRAGA